MRVRRIFSLLLVVILIASNVAAAKVAEEKNDTSYTEDGILVRFKNTSKKEDVHSLKQRYSLKSVKTYDIGVELLKIGNGADPVVIAEALSNNRNIEFAHPDYILEQTVVREQPESVYSSEVEVNRQWGLETIDAEGAWTNASGADVVVAVIDSGVQHFHEDLEDNMWFNAAEVNGVAGVDDDGNGYVDDYHGWNFIDVTEEHPTGTNDIYEDKVYETSYYSDGTVYGTYHVDKHGTHVAGTIAAVGNNVDNEGNLLGTVGVAPVSKIMSLKFFGSFASSGSTSAAIEAIEYAGNNGAHVINASWGGYFDNTALKLAIEAFPGIFVTSAGNDGLDNDEIHPEYGIFDYHNPSSYDSPNIVSVASIDSDLSLSYFSNYGDISVDVAAPGRSIYNAYPWEDLTPEEIARYDGLKLYEGGEYIYMSGTSMATPHVVGIVALMMSTGNYDNTAELNGTPGIDDDNNGYTDDLYMIDAIIQDLYDSVVPSTDLNGMVYTNGIVNANNAVTIGIPIVDTTPPNLESTNPVHNASDVPVDLGVITLTFDEVISLQDASGITLSSAANVPGISSIVDENNKHNLLITLSEDLDSYSDYTLTLSDSAVADSTGNLYGGISINFTSEDVSAEETVITYERVVDKVRNRYNVTVTATVKVTQYNNPVVGKSLYGYWTVDGKAVDSAVKLGETDGAGLFVTSHTVNTRNSNTAIELVLTEPIADATPPKLETSSPADQSVDVDINMVEIVLNFDESIELVNQNGVVLEADGGAAVSTVASVTDNIMYVTINGPLTYSTTYTLSIGGGAIEDNAANPYAGGNLSFTTTDNPAFGTDINVICTNTDFVKSRGKYTTTATAQVTVRADGLLAVDKVLRGYWTVDGNQYAEEATFGPTDSDGTFEVSQVFEGLRSSSAVIDLYLYE